jgi:hypothetical protein
MGDLFVGLALKFGAVLLPPLATVMAGFAVALLNKKLKQMGIELTDAQDERLRQLVRDGILAAEEAAHRNPNLSSTEKHAIAVNQTVARDPDVSLQTASRVVDQVLPVVRAELENPPPRITTTIGRIN